MRCWRWGRPGAAFAQAETTSFEYDAQGRLTESSRSGGPASGTVQALAYDRAGNRTNLTVTGAPGGEGVAAPGSLGGEATVDVGDEDGAADAAEPADAPAPTDDPPVSQGAPLHGESPPEPEPGA